jgi:hypothetical protein
VAPAVVSTQAKARAESAMKLAVKLAAGTAAESSELGRGV